MIRSIGSLAVLCTFVALLGCCSSHDHDRDYRDRDRHDRDYNDRHDRDYHDGDRRDRGYRDDRDYRDDHRGRLEAKIDSLDARLSRDRGDWCLSVKYKVEVEAARPGQLDLVIHVTERGRELLDRRGQPVTFFIPLDNPRDADHGEFEYAGRFREDLPARSFRDADRLGIEALVVDRRTERVVARERESVDREHD
jgi:hypothetical protein